MRKGSEGSEWFLARRNDRSDEAVAVTRNCLDESRVIGIVIDSGAKFLEDHIKAAVEVDEGAFRPKMSSQFLAADNFSRVFKQDEQDAEGLVLDLDAHAIAGQSLLGDVRFKEAESEAARRGSC